MFRTDVPALTASRLAWVNRKTSQRIYACLRRRVVDIAREGSRTFTGEVEIGEYSFGPRRVRGRRGRGAAGKTPVVGSLKRGDKVFTCVVATCSRAEPEPIIKGQVFSRATVYTDGWLGYDGVLLSGYKYYRIFHHENGLARPMTKSARHAKMKVLPIFIPATGHHGVDTVVDSTLTGQCSTSP